MEGPGLFTPGANNPQLKAKVQRKLGGAQWGWGQEQGSEGAEEGGREDI